MSEELRTTARGESLVNRTIYAVCDTACESADHFRGELYELRRRFFTQGKRNCQLKLSGQYLGCESRAQGSMSHHSLRWKKVAAGVHVEESFSVQKSFVIVRRDLNGSICGKIYFDRSNRWLKTEYFSSADYTTASVMLKPGEASDTVERFTYNPIRKNYDSVSLFPVPYESGTANQSHMNAEFGESFLLLASAEGEFMYCPQEEQQARLAAQQSFDNEASALRPLWTAEDAPEATEAPENLPTFTSLKAPVALSEANPHVPPQNLPENAPVQPLPEEVPLEEADLTLECAVPPLSPTFIDVPENLTIIEAGEQFQYTGKLMSGLREGRGRTDRPDGGTIFDGEYRHGQRHGFGVSYYQSGNLSYVGGYQEDKRSGLGIAFREEDHAMHVAVWQEGKPGEYATLFDPQGNLRYSGKLLEGKKVGLGIRTQGENTFVGKYEGQEMPTTAALFDQEGNLCYSGEWVEGKRHGKGTEFDKEGQIVYSGEWKDDRYFSGVLYKKIDEA